MRTRSIFVALLGLAVAGGSVFAAREFLNVTPVAALNNESPDIVNVIAAGKDIPFGKEIESHMLTTIAWPRSAVPAGVFTDYSKIIPQDGQEPRRAKRALSQGELLLMTKVSKFGEKVTIVQTLGANTRAMAIKVDAETAVGGFVTPGDRVDIVMTQGKSNDMRAVTIMQNIRVIGVDQVSDEQSNTPEIARTVTVEITPQQGQKLALAQKAGSLSLSLRTLDAAIDEPLDSVRLSDLMREKSPVVEEKTASTRIKVRRGTDIQIVEISN